MTPPRRRSSLTKVLVAVAMVAAIAATVGFVHWDEKREEEAAFEDLALEQTRVAIAASSAFGARLEAAEKDAKAEGSEFRASLVLPSALHDIARIERPGELVVLLLPPGSRELTTTGGGSLGLPVVSDALAGTATSIRLSREEATLVGLPARAAFAGLARIDAGPAGHWGVVVIGSASRERARELRSRIRVIVSATFVAGVVFMLGNLAFKRMAKEMEFERELSLAEVRQRSDERLVRASRAAVMGTLATGVAHEMGTPLGIIVARAEQLEKRLAGDERALRSARVILEQVERIHLVVRGFLNLARGGEPSLARVDAKTLAEGAVRLTQHRFEKAGVELRADVIEGHFEVQCDPRLFEHALVNLLLNACEACARGGEVAIQVRGDGEHVTFAVDDDGIGIRSEDAARAVEPFFTTKPAGQGTGLGLAITNEIVKAHRGVLTLLPKEPRGTRVTIEVPVARDAKERAA